MMMPTWLGSRLKCILPTMFARHVESFHLYSLFGRPAMALLAKRSVPETMTSAVRNRGLYVTQCQNMARNSRCVAIMGVATLIYLSTFQIDGWRLYHSPVHMLTFGCQPPLLPPLASNRLLQAVLAFLCPRASTPIPNTHCLQHHTNNS